MAKISRRWEAVFTGSTCVQGVDAELDMTAR
jgi:hypothetical protein